MGEKTRIEWTDKTWNPWVGCSKVSPGCSHCYAESWADRFGRKFTDRTRTKDWKAPIRWDRQFVEAVRFYKEEDIGPEPTRPKVFPSLCDWLDEKVPIEWLADFLWLIYKTPNIDWILLTKRPQNWLHRIEATEYWMNGKFGPKNFLVGNWLLGTAPPNIWLGISCEDQQRADERISELLKIPAAVRWVSCEPLLGPIDLNSVEFGSNTRQSALSPTYMGRPYSHDAKLDWLVIGGESGTKARPCDLDWIRSLVKQSKKAGVPVFVKQLGSNAEQDLSAVIPSASEWETQQDPMEAAQWDIHRHHCKLQLQHPKGGDPSEWPEDLRVREWPKGKP